MYFQACSREVPFTDTEKTDSASEVMSGYFHELKVALKKDRGRLWNHSLYGPVILVEKQSRKLYANTPDAHGVLVKEGNVYTGILPENVNVSSTSKEWEGTRWAMLVLPVPEDREERLSALIHESFHRIQPAIGFDSIPMVSCVHLDKKLGRVFLKLELEALKRALYANTDNESKRHLNHALLFRQNRHLLFPGALITENPLELNEGLAEYTANTLCGMKDGRMRQHLSERVDLLYSLPGFSGAYAYFTIPMYGYFMYKEDKHWNLDISEKTNLSEYLLNFFDQPAYTDISILADHMAVEYGLEAILEVEDVRESEQLKILENYKRSLLDPGALSIQLVKKRMSFNPGNLIPLEGYGIIFPSLRLVDVWGILSVEDGALLNEDRSKVTVSQVMSISDTLVTGRGWTIRLNEKWRLVKKESGYGLVSEEEGEF
jgi:hypothetical protein